MVTSAMATLQKVKALMVDKFYIWLQVAIKGQLLTAGQSYFGSLFIIIK